jgi:2-polyprenyl-3-methyl-5-hydroxy-6-metoxy-1,4-benzoquinol methylase
MTNDSDISGYKWNHANLNHSHNYLLPMVLDLLQESNVKEKCLFEVGCGNGSVAYELQKQGWKITGVDPSVEGIKYANKKYPKLKLYLGSAYDDLQGKYGQFAIVLSLEVIEHVYFPRKYISTIYKLLEPKGQIILSTPYHGYFKNLALALTGKMDAHFTALWDNGHIKFWSFKTLKQLLEEFGFIDIKFYRVGRIPIIEKSMIVIATKP